MNKKVNFKNGCSVIIPTFNRAEFLYPTLLCLCNQKDLPCEYEIIVIDSGDDGSDVITANVKKSFNCQIFYKKIKKCKNRSLIRNEGAKLARYGILCFLDNDILVPPDFIRSHFEEHQKTKNLVLLGLRKSLLQFDISKLSEEALLTNFSILEQLPYYTDERLKTYSDTEPWRFVFSHTLSMQKTDFIKAGGFYPDFGEHWGFEDLELGFNLQLSGCVFKLLENQFTFHQPHFLQSNKEQHEKSHNASLFLQLHNCFECELYESFYTSFDEFYPVLKTLKDSFEIPPKEIQKNYNLIFGCLFSSLENIQYKNMCLGAYSIQKSNSCNKLLILNTFFAFPRIIQMSILSEAFRVSSKVYLENTESKKVEEFITIAKDAGLVLTFRAYDNKSEFIKTDTCSSKLFVMLLPDIFEPEKRYVYNFLASHMQQNGSYVNLRDLRKTENVESDDFCLPLESQKLISKNFERCFGKTQLQFINSLSMLLADFSPAMENSSKSFVIHDEDYALKFNSLKFRKADNANHFNESVFVCLSFLSVYEICQKYMEKKKSELNKLDSKNKDSFICFMENGFLEDGIDLILEAFSKYYNNHPDARLTIKIPDYNNFTRVVYTLHNDISKTSKMFAAKQKIELDYRKLNEKAKLLGVEPKISIICKNLSINEIISLIDKNETLILASRSCNVPPQVYISLLLEKRTVISQHHIILKWFQKLCAVTESLPCEFANELQVPASCMNVAYLAFRTNTDSLLNNFNAEREIISDELKMKIESEAYKIIDTYFVKK